MPCVIECVCLIWLQIGQTWGLYRRGCYSRYPVAWRDGVIGPIALALVANLIGVKQITSANLGNRQLILR